MREKKYSHPHRKELGKSTEGDTRYFLSVGKNSSAWYIRTKIFLRAQDRSRRYDGASRSCAARIQKCISLERASRRRGARRKGGLTSLRVIRLGGGEIWLSFNFGSHGGAGGRGHWNELSEFYLVLAARRERSFGKQTCSRGPIAFTARRSSLSLAPDVIQRLCRAFFAVRFALFLSFFTLFFVRQPTRISLQPLYSREG